MFWNLDNLSLGLIFIIYKKNFPRFFRTTIPLIALCLHGSSENKDCFLRFSTIYQTFPLRSNIFKLVGITSIQSNIKITNDLKYILFNFPMPPP